MIVLSYHKKGCLTNEPAVDFSALCALKIDENDRSLLNQKIRVKLIKRLKIQCGKDKNSLYKDSRKCGGEI